METERCETERGRRARETRVSLKRHCCTSAIRERDAKMRFTVFIDTVYDLSLAVRVDGCDRARDKRACVQLVWRNRKCGCFNLCACMHASVSRCRYGLLHACLGVSVWMGFLVVICLVHPNFAVQLHVGASVHQNKPVGATQPGSLPCRPGVVRGCFKNRELG